MKDLIPITSNQVEIYFDVPKRERILRDLAERGPVTDLGAECLECGVLLNEIPDDAGPNPGDPPGDTGWFDNPDNHRAACIWRSARELYPADLLR